MKMARWEHIMRLRSLVFLFIMIKSPYCDAKNRFPLGISNNIPAAMENPSVEPNEPPSNNVTNIMRKAFVWYASYGSNMDMQRFLCYIEGGQVVGMERPCEGSRDKTRPQSTRWGTANYRMFFGRNHTKAWGPGGVAFLELHKDRKHKSHIRIYKISLQQFNDVMRQENSGKFVKNFPLFTWTDLMSIRHRGYMFMKAIKAGWYKTVVYMGDVEMIPVLTFTCSPSVIEDFRSGKRPLRAPSKGYTDILMKALVEQAKLPVQVARNYIRDSYEKPLNGSGSHPCNVLCSHE